MPYEVTSQNTKNMLASSFARLLERKPFVQVTVTEIIADCGVNRKTFYYHFENTERLLLWLLEREVFDVVAAWDLMNDYRGAVVFVMDYLTKNRRLVHNVIESLEREKLRSLFYGDFHKIIHAAIVQSIGILSLSVSESFTRFLANMYAEIIGALVIDWIYERNTDEKKLVDYICVIFNEMLPHMLRTASEKGL